MDSLIGKVRVQSTVSRLLSKLFAVIFYALSAATFAHADLALFLAEPYGGYGKLVPIGHTAVYLDRVCAATPTELRRCNPGEPGIVIGRYRKIAGRDWFAIPLIPYLYSVDSASEVPDSTTPETVKELRDAYRREHLQEYAPDAADGGTPGGQWIELIGAAYDRRLFAFQLQTSEAQDDAFIRAFNARQNKGHFSWITSNCADFAREVINFYFPGAVRRSIIADLGITTPKQIARALVRYGKQHPETGFSSYSIAQVPGNRPPSRHARGVVEALVKSKKYSVPIIVVNPWVPPVLLAGYLTTGRFNPSSYAKIAYNPTELETLAASSHSAPATVGAGSVVEGASFHIQPGVPSDGAH